MQTLCGLYVQTPFEKIPENVRATFCANNGSRDGVPFDPVTLEPLSGHVARVTDFKRLSVCYERTTAYRASEIDSIFRTPVVWFPIRPSSEIVAACSAHLSVQEKRTFPWIALTPEAMDISLAARLADAGFRDGVADVARAAKSTLGDIDARALRRSGVDL